MSQPDHRADDSHFSKWMENSATLEESLEIVQLTGARARAMEEAGAAIARQLNGPLTALLLYMNEIKQHSHQFSQAAGNRIYLQQVVENALEQTERVCAMMKQMADAHGEPIAPPCSKPGPKPFQGDGLRKPGVMFASDADHKPLTKREREVLNL